MRIKGKVHAFEGETKIPSPKGYVDGNQCAYMLRFDYGLQTVHDESFAVAMDEDRSTH